MDQLNLFEEPKEGGRVVNIRDGAYRYWPRLFKTDEANHYLETLDAKIAWRQESMQIYGKEVNFPRLTAWYGDQDKPYTFSGITLQPHPWSSELRAIKEDIEPIAGVKFNSVLLNLYRDGKDSISWHTDAEAELGQNPVIASVNFGAERTFQLRHIKTKERINIELGHGSLLIMEGTLQHFWQHQVPKTKKPKSARINLTFRVIK